MLHSIKEKLVLNDELEKMREEAFVTFDIVAFDWMDWGKLRQMSVRRIDLQTGRGEVVPLLN
jgi:hypothetical protein